MAKNPRNYSKSEVGQLKDTIAKLKSQIRHLSKQIENLKHKNKTLGKAWKHTENLLEENAENKSLEEMLLEVETKKIPKKKSIPSSNGKKVNKEEARLRWKKWREENL